MEQAEASMVALSDIPTDEYWGVVVSDNFPLLYARVAAKIDGFSNFSEWVASVLRKWAEERINKDLDNFLKKKKALSSHGTIWMTKSHSKIPLSTKLNNCWTF